MSRLRSWLDSSSGGLRSAWITGKAQMIHKQKPRAETGPDSLIRRVEELKGQGSSLNARKQYAEREQQILDRNGGCLGRDPLSGRPVTWSDPRKPFRAS